MTRDCKDSFRDCSVWINKPWLNDKQHWMGESAILVCTAKDFKAFFGYTPRKGSIKEIKGLKIIEKGK